MRPFHHPWSAALRQGLPLLHFSPQPEPFLTLRYQGLTLLHFSAHPKPLLPLTPPPKARSVTLQRYTYVEPKTGRVKFLPCATTHLPPQSPSLSPSRWRNTRRAYSERRGARGMLPAGTTSRPAQGPSRGLAVEMHLNLNAKLEGSCHVSQLQSLVPVCSTHGGQGSRAKAWCLLIHADASLPLFCNTGSKLSTCSPPHPARPRGATGRAVCAPTDRGFHLSAQPQTSLVTATLKPPGVALNRRLR